jgi:hypothetical protein
MWFCGDCDQARNFESLDLDGTAYREVIRPASAVGQVAYAQGVYRNP